MGSLRSSVAVVTGLHVGVRVTVAGSLGCGITGVAGSLGLRGSRVTGVVRLLGSLGPGLTWVTAVAGLLMSLGF